MMEPPQLTGEALALYTFVQAQLQEIHNVAAAANQETENRLTSMEKRSHGSKPKNWHGIAYLGNEVWISGIQGECDGSRRRG